MLTIGAYWRIPALAGLGFCMLMHGCANAPPVADPLCVATATITVNCEKESPDCLSKSGRDAFSPETLREIYTYNETRAKVCRR